MTQTTAPAFDLEAFRAKATPEQYQEFLQLLTERAKDQVFFPNPGAQAAAVASEADILGYGGAAGGGKSILITGLAVAHHKRSAIIRPQKNQTKKFVQEIQKMVGHSDGYSSQSSSWNLTTPDGQQRYIEFYGLDNPGDEQKQQGNDFDAKLYDEATQMREADVRYTLTWNRTDDPDQRVRAVLAFNPPTTPEGRWVIRFFAPWLDKTHPRPARDGELRWFATVGTDGDYEVAGPDPFVLRPHPHTGNLVPWYRFDAASELPEDIIRPMSRTFIRAKVTDNPYYMKTGYIQQLQKLPEPLRSQMLHGDFMAGVEDDAHQLIPTAWIDAAMQRWRDLEAPPPPDPTNPHARPTSPRSHAPGPMDSIGVDAARGGNMGSHLGATGNDELVIAPRHGTWFAPLKTFKGVSIDDGAKASALIVTELRDNAPVHIDVVGIGTSPYDFLRTNGIHTIPVNGAAASVGMDSSGLLKFTNFRAEYHWRMREALDPRNPLPVALPPDEQLAVDLAAPRWTLNKAGVVIEPKDDIKKRIGRSPDRGEACMFALIDTKKRFLVPGPMMGMDRLAELSYSERRFKELEE